MSAKGLLFELYKKFYEQRSVLNDAPPLTLDVEHQNLDTFDENTADKELTSLVSYMMGTKSFDQLPWNDALALVEKYYANQPQWQKLLLDYFSYTLEKEKENIFEQQTELLQEILDQLEAENSEKSPQ